MSAKYDVWMRTHGQDQGLVVYGDAQLDRAKYEARKRSASDRGQPYTVTNQRGKVVAVFLNGEAK